MSISGPPAHTNHQNYRKKTAPAAAHPRTRPRALAGPEPERPRIRALWADVDECFEDLGIAFGRRTVAPLVAPLLTTLLVGAAAAPALTTTASVSLLTELVDLLESCLMRVPDSRGSVNWVVL